MVTVKNMTAKVKTNAKVEKERKENLEVSKAVHRTIVKLQKPEPQNRLLARMWLIYLVLNKNEYAVEEETKLIGDHSLSTTDIYFFEKFSKSLQDEIIEVLKGYQVKFISYVGIGNMILALEALYPKFDYMSYNFGISGIKSTKVKKVFKLLKEMYPDIIDGKVKQKFFMKRLEALEQSKGN